MNIAPKNVLLFYDIVSPYSWIAFETLCRYQSVWNISLKLKPFFLGGVMKGAENNPPGFVQRKAMYMQTDISRVAHHFGVPLKFPSNPGEVMFVKGTLNAQRFLTSIDLTNPEYTESLSRALWMRIWSQDLDVTETNSLSDAADSVGIPPKVKDQALKDMKSEGVKTRLKKITDEALDYGAFGAPTMVVFDKENKPNMVFGSDRIHIIADILGENYIGPLKEIDCKL